MKQFYEVIDQDDDRELVYKPTEYSPLHEVIADLHPIPRWVFEYEDCRITVYPIALFQMPVGESKEEMEQRCLQALNLI